MHPNTIVLPCGRREHFEDNSIIVKLLGTAKTLSSLQCLQVYSLPRAEEKKTSVLEVATDGVSSIRVLRRLSSGQTPPIFFSETSVRMMMISRQPGISGEKESSIIRHIGSSITDQFQDVDYQTSKGVGWHLVGQGPRSAFVDGS